MCGTTSKKKPASVAGLESSINALLLVRVWKKTSFNLLAWHPRVRCHRSKKPACRPVSCHQSLLCCVDARLRLSLSSCSSAYISRVERLGNSRSVKTDLDCFVRSGHVAARGATEKKYISGGAIDATSGRARRRKKNYRTSPEVRD